MIPRRHALAITGCILAAPGMHAFGQVPSVARRVGVLVSSSLAIAADPIEVLKRRVDELGRTDRRVVEYRILAAAGDLERLAVLAQELVAWPAEVIVAGAEASVAALRRATSAIPIVLAGTSRAVENHYVASLARPDGNVTGVISQGVDAIGKMVEIVHELVPAATRVAIVLNDANPTHEASWAIAKRIGAARGMTAIRVVARRPQDFDSMAARILREGAQGVVVLSDGMFLAGRAELVRSMQATRLPVAYGHREYVLAGGLLCYGATLPYLFELASVYVDKILRGARPADLPVQQPMVFNLSINLRTARSIGVKIPQSILLRADEVIE